MQIRYIAEIISDEYDYPITIDNKSQAWVVIDNKSQAWVDNLSVEGKYFVKVLGVDGYVYQLFETTDEIEAHKALSGLNAAIAKIACINEEFCEGKNGQAAADEYDVKDYIDDYETSSKYGEEWYD